MTSTFLLEVTLLFKGFLFVFVFVLQISVFTHSFVALFPEICALGSHVDIPSTLGYSCSTLFLQLDFLHTPYPVAYLHEGDSEI